MKIIPKKMYDPLNDTIKSKMTSNSILEDNSKSFNLETNIKEDLINTKEQKKGCCDFVTRIFRQKKDK